MVVQAGVLTVTCTPASGPGTRPAPCLPFHQNVFPGRDVQPIYTWVQLPDKVDPKPEHVPFLLSFFLPFHSMVYFPIALLGLSFLI